MLSHQEVAVGSKKGQGYGKSLNELLPIPPLREDHFVDLHNANLGRQTPHGILTLCVTDPERKKYKPVDQQSVCQGLVEHNDAKPC